ncbi:uroporphyrinogen-III synthase [Paenibacillus thiaminolyticus]|uniref:Uroporphyrinogen-III synthase n=3 Tax=Paenibacillus thiaminolyticus TaxID=49283 RepID=A0AAP9DTV7_PANTH|nr:uroporphyrinogen-III synthase [Paenibacillus thiaminolyticus]MCY9533647.1 uroporphyrinogen-III synthase [Paenibacillus thiaminolyticus]MCY9600869.1 uroporphyrinogen-III synthase [Paenibacillus thiaminolyticus]MCY9607698.1 uroporphyrinogen-III synthase [Paenibacillus thiaminolyticus]MCY9611497.1 uroporphyrinogen-III synthase [Paenibacillus thiaminolyticus]MCY9617232.1 uroporphyrinogen-III synthase [Paenibacillus thiaminolyticus]
MAKLEGKTIVITGPRKAEEMSALVRKQGGTPWVRPMQGTMLEGFERLEAEVDRLLEAPVSLAVWTTGMGLDRLVEAAREAGKEEAFLRKMTEMKHAARGYKTVNALKRIGIAPAVRDDDGSTAGLLRSLDASGTGLAGRLVSLQLHGDPAPALVQYFKQAGADTMELMPYRHTPPPEDVLRQLAGELLAGEVDAVAMTSAPQARFLFDYAKRNGLTERLLEVFANRTWMAAVGKVTAAAIAEAGVQRIMIPEEERMGALIVELSKHFGKESGAAE